MVRAALWVVLTALYSGGLLTSAKPHTPYVTGGDTAKVGAWPWMASIRMDGAHRCGGVLIKPSVVLSSANCVTRLNLLTSSVVLGLHNQEDRNIGKPEAIKVDSIITHHDWPQPGGYADLVIVKLSTPASNSSFIQPIALPDRDADLTDQVCTVTGWGRPAMKGSVAELQQRRLVVWSDVLCRRCWQDVDVRRTCASPPNGNTPTGICQLDAGGPLSCPANGGFVLGGVAVDWEASCDGDAPGLFSNIPSYVDWINDNTA